MITAIVSYVEQFQTAPKHGLRDHEILVGA
jgi:hypothetical protein